MALARQRAMFGDTMVLVKAMHEGLQNTIRRMKINLAPPLWSQGSSYKQKIYTICQKWKSISFDYLGDDLDRARFKEGDG